MAGEFVVRYSVPVWVHVDPEERKTTAVWVETDAIGEPTGYVPAEKVAGGWMDEDVVPLPERERVQLEDAELHYGWPAWRLGQ